MERVEELLQSVNKAVTNADEQVEIGLAQVVEVDLAFFQLLHGTRRTLEALGKRLVCVDPLPAHLAQKADLCGLAELNWPSTGGQGNDRAEGKKAYAGQGGGR